MTTTIHVGHVLDKLAEIPERSVHMVWTSVPYWGLRSYGTEPQVWGGDPDCAHDFSEHHERDHRHKMAGESRSTLQGGKQNQRSGQFAARSDTCRHCGAWRGEHGLEPTFDLWLQHEVEIFRAVRRVLRDDGTVWLSCGDAYASSTNGRPAADIVDDNRTFRDKPCSTVGGVFKAKDRIMMPARLAIALQEDGWWLRDEILWHKPNPMPSSVRDRTTPAHEMLYMLSKKARYFYDRVAIQEPIAEATAKDRIDGDRFRPERGWPGENPQCGGGRLGAGSMRNKRSVWGIALEPFPGAHFATAPTALVRPCILAGTSQKGVCPKCGAPWVRQTDVERAPDERAGKSALRGAGHFRDGAGPANREGREFEKVVATTTTGWAPSCGCPDHEPIPATVLDPFGGAGTTALVAQQLGRDAILIELNPEYASMARKRLRENLGRVASDMEDDSATDLPLFAEPTP